MQNKTKLNPFLRIFTIILVLIPLILIISIVMYYYVFSISEPEGLSLTSWPNNFTKNFSIWMDYTDGKLQINDIGLSRLKEYKLWIQVLDENCTELFSYNKPDDIQINYSISELIDINTVPYQNGYTVFASSFQKDEKSFTYIIGFPYSIGKYMLYYNGEHIQRLSPLARKIISVFFIFLIFTIIGCELSIMHQSSKITNGIKKINLRTYEPFKEKGLFCDIYKALNKMDNEIRYSDQVQKDTDVARKQWITNITHDLKTPLSPIKGYAELLTEYPMNEYKNAEKYGTIILKNANCIEKLINELKLAYQLDSDSFPLQTQNIHLSRYLKEIIIDIINDPSFSNCDIEFEDCQSDLVVPLDPELFKRAVQNIIINALIHNPVKTKVKVTVKKLPEQKVYILIQDNGNGISEKELSNLFNRYYRGTNTSEKTAGTGLGLAIAKQVIITHGGEISVTSELGNGTTFSILLYQ